MSQHKILVSKSDSSLNALAKRSINKKTEASYEASVFYFQKSEIIVVVVFLVLVLVILILVFILVFVLVLLVLILVFRSLILVVHNT